MIYFQLKNVIAKYNNYLPVSVKVATNYALYEVDSEQFVHITNLCPVSSCIYSSNITGSSTVTTV